MGTAELPDSTLDGLHDRPRGASGTWAHRAGVLTLTVLVLAGLLGLLGPRTGVATGSGEGWTLTVEHPALTRAGEPARLHLEIEHAAGLTGPVELALCDDWFDEYDFHTWYPTPAKETSRPGELTYEFDPPDGTTATLTLDATSAPGGLGSRQTCAVSVLDDGSPVATAEFTTWRLP